MRSISNYIQERLSTDKDFILGESDIFTSHVTDHPFKFTGTFVVNSQNFKQSKIYIL